MRVGLTELVCFLKKETPEPFLCLTKYTHSTQRDGSALWIFLSFILRCAKARGLLICFYSPSYCDGVSTLHEFNTHFSSEEKE